MTESVTLIIVAVIAAAPGTIAAIFSRKNNKQLQEIHLSMNSRLDELVKSSGKAEHARGVEEERARGKRR